MPDRLKSLRLFGWLFLGSLTICLWLGHVSRDDQSLSWGTAAVAESFDATQLTQQGWERYQNGDVQGAIDRWQTALSRISHRPSEARATILKYLVRAEQLVGQTDQAIANLDRLRADYRQTGNLLQAGRMQAEQAQVYSSLGQHRKAIALLCGEHATAPNCTSDSAIAIARAQTDTTGLIAALGSLGNAHRLSGDYNLAIQDLEAARSLATKTNNQPYIYSVLNELGNTYASLVKRDNRRRQYAEQSSDELQAQTFEQSAAHYNDNAIAYFKASLSVAQAQNNPVNELRSLLNLIVPLQRKQERQERGKAQGQGNKETRRQEGQSNTHPSPLTLHSLTLLREAQTQFTRLPASREKAYAAIRLATLTQLVQAQPADLDADAATRCLTTDISPAVVMLLEQAITIAQTIEDSQSESFALGRLGHLYECHQDYTTALSLTQQAQLTAATQDNRYLWEWQTGRILRAQGHTAQAIAAYDTAVKTLENIRGDLAIASRDFQFDFRDTVEPVYRELTALYLEQATGKQAILGAKQLGESAPLPASVKSVESALETIDRLRLAELRNYFGDDCALDTATKPVTLIDQKTAVLSSIILDDWVAVILTLPTPNKGFRSQVHWLPVPSREVRAAVNDLRLKLEKRSDLANTYQPRSQQLYDWLIRPFATALQNAQIETLVFIQDGILRSVPMAALHDGNQFLVEQYAIASTLSLTLVDPTQIDRKSMRVLGFGLTQPSVVEGPTFFAPLSYVKTELDSIQSVVPGSKGLLDGDFTIRRLGQELTQSAFPIVHLATHGRFGIDSRDTFLVTGERSQEKRMVSGGGERILGQGDQEKGWQEDGKYQKRSQPSPQTYNEKLTMNALYQMIRSIGRDKTLELLTLTACETAAGSDRDALGIAGISLQAGARSTIASLWQVDDQATAQLITHFYQSLRQGMSRAKALQLAQKTWLKEHSDERHHPGYWAALILVGNWL